jgi:hypothetical protein
MAAEGNGMVRHGYLSTLHVSAEPLSNEEKIYPADESSPGHRSTLKASIPEGLRAATVALSYIHFNLVHGLDSETAALIGKKPLSYQAT